MQVYLRANFEKEVGALPKSKFPLMMAFSLWVSFYFSFPWLEVLEETLALVSFV